MPLTRVNADDSCVCPLTRVCVPDTCTLSIVYIMSHVSVFQSNTEGGSTKVLLFHGTTKRAATVKSRSVAALKECVEKEFNVQDSVSYPWGVFLIQSGIYFLSICDSFGEHTLSILDKLLSFNLTKFHFFKIKSKSFEWKD